MSNEGRVVLDAGVYVSRLLRPDSVPAQAVARAIAKETVLISDELIAELAGVLARPKFAAYIDPGDAREFLQVLGGIAMRVEVTAHVRMCRDPKDDHILALAQSGQARAIVTGDRDLLTLDPFGPIRIFVPRTYLES
ncbi:MAG: putative toxin-antitoxin system toxin component, PIN family [Tagaea sp.]|nr:putative toxin-antitoxin system toxin component, PIN family [Tagaea sp.]